MAIAATLQEFLSQRGMNFDVVKHSHTGSSTESAEAAHVRGDRLAKAVMVEDDAGYVMVVIPATHRVHLGWLHKALDRQVGLATESELGDLFRDCEVGAVPPLGTAYGIETIVDDALMEQPEVYLEAGNHEELVHLSGDQFRTLMDSTRKGVYSERI